MRGSPKLSRLAVYVCIALQSLLVSSATSGVKAVSSFAHFNELTMIGDDDRAADVTSTISNAGSALGEADDTGAMQSCAFCYGAIC